MSPPQWDDLVRSGIGSRLNIAAGKLDNNLALKGIDFADDCDITDDQHKYHIPYQIYHMFKLDGKFNLHFHWFQAQAAIPNWWARWRPWRNGQVDGSWTEMKWSGHGFTYPGSGTILQITAFPSIDLAPLGLAVSDYIDVEFTRDGDNTSALFTGADPVAGPVTVRDVDPHLEVDSSGSNEEYVK